MTDLQKEIDRAKFYKEQIESVWSNKSIVNKEEAEKDLVDDFLLIERKPDFFIPGVGSMLMLVKGKAATELLIANGADVNYNYEGNTPLSTCAQNLSKAEVLLKNGADPFICKRQYKNVVQQMRDTKVIKYDSFGIKMGEDIQRVNIQVAEKIYKKIREIKEKEYRRECIEEQKKLTPEIREGIEMTKRSGYVHISRSPVPRGRDDR